MATPHLLLVNDESGAHFSWWVSGSPACDSLIHLRNPATVISWLANIFATKGNDLAFVNSYWGTVRKELGRQACDPNAQSPQYLHCHLQGHLFALGRCALVSLCDLSVYPMNRINIILLLMKRLGSGGQMPLQKCLFTELKVLHYFMTNRLFSLVPTIHSMH